MPCPLAHMVLQFKGAASTGAGLGSEQGVLMQRTLTGSSQVPTEQTQGRVVVPGVLQYRADH